MQSTLTVADALTQGVVDCPPRTSMRSAARLMADHQAQAVYVIDEANRWSLVSDLDVVAAAAGDLDAHTAGDSAVRPLLTVTGDEPLTVAAALMARTSVTHLAVLDEANRYPIGVLSALDVVRALSRDVALRREEVVRDEPFAAAVVTP
jgi:CBS domain-containing protein